MTLKAKMILNGPKRRDFYAELIEKMLFCHEIAPNPPECAVGVKSILRIEMLNIYFFLVSGKNQIW